MDETVVDRLVAATGDGGVECDGLRTAETDTGYSLSVPAVDHEALTESEFRAVARDHERYVTNWSFWTQHTPDRPAHRAFLRRLEGAEERGVDDRYDALVDGIEAEWGELLVTVTLEENGVRRYHLRHVDDTGADADTLETHEEPLEARQLSKHDGDGRYRPLKTAPSLQRGWQFEALGPAALVEAVEQFYPATVPNWYREREGDLDVTHWEEATGRQTGIYGVVRTWNRQEGYEHVNWVAEACCDDSQCLKRREWEYDEETDLDADGGDGAFPCREPCSLVIAAARQWTKLEGEQPQTYEFELTPSEKEQVEDIIDAVADGRADEIREADVYEGANRYRTRFLRAKLFDDEGALCGVSTEDED